MRTHTHIRDGQESSGQVVKNCTRSRGQGSFSAVKNLDRGRKRSYGKRRSDHPLCSNSILVAIRLYRHVFLDSCDGEDDR